MISPDRPRTTVQADLYLAAASHPAVTAVGAAELSRGGNAIDATVAMAAMCWLMLPGQCGIGGDSFAVIREPDGSVWTVGASGFGPDGGTPEFYRGRGLAKLPLIGPLAVAAPGAIAALSALHDRGATRSLADLWEGAARTAEAGVPCSAKTRADVAAFEEHLHKDPGAGARLLPGGRLPRTGQKLVFPELAATIRKLAVAPDSLYAGQLAERAVAWLSAESAPYDGPEWELSAQTFVGPSVAVPYGGLLLHETPPPSPGWMVLAQALLLDGLLVDREWLGADAVLLLAAAARHAFRHRQLCATDTEVWRASLEADAVADARTRLGAIGVDSVGVTAGGDTTSTVAVDRDGRAVSFIQSLAFTFGACVSIPGTGVLLNNRLGRGAYLIDGHPNEVRPRRRPMHTLNAWMLTDRDGRLRWAGNTPGGDGQVQWNMQLISHLVDHRKDPQAAVAAPRFTVTPGSDADTLGRTEELHCETRLGTAPMAALRNSGQRVRDVGSFGAGGSALVVGIDPTTGRLCGGADPRQDAVVAGE